jgi:hypothetical protein
MSEKGLRRVKNKREVEDDSIRILGVIKPLEDGDNIEEYNDKKLNAKREKFKMGSQGSTSTIV